MTSREVVIDPQVNGGFRRRYRRCHCPQVSSWLLEEVGWGIVAFIQIKQLYYYFVTKHKCAIQSQSIRTDTNAKYIYNVNKNNYWKISITSIRNEIIQFVAIISFKSKTIKMYILKNTFLKVKHILDERSAPFNCCNIS